MREEEGARCPHWPEPRSQKPTASGIRAPPASGRELKGGNRHVAEIPGENLPGEEVGLV